MFSCDDVLKCLKEEEILKETEAQVQVMFDILSIFLNC